MHAGRISMALGRVWPFRMQRLPDGTLPTKACTEYGSSVSMGNAKLDSVKFRTCILITPFNRSVFHFSIHRTLNMAASLRVPLFWMQAVDTPPPWFSSGFSKEDLAAMKRHWLSYHARKTD